jgi:hypothetical protein
MLSWALTAASGPALTGHTRVVGALIGLLMLVTVLELVRRRKLQERYIVLWVLAAGSVVGACAVPQSTTLITDALGVRAAFAGMIGLLFLLLFAFALHTTVVVSQLSGHVTRLAQELAVERARNGEQR